MDANLFPRVLGFNSRKSHQECGGHLLAAKVPKVCTFYRMTQILQHMQTFAGFRVYFARVYFAKCWESMQFCRITQVLQHTQTFAGSRVHFAKFHFAKCWEFMQFCRIYIVLQNLLKFAKVTQFCWIYLLAAAGGGCWRLWAAMGGYGRLLLAAAAGGGSGSNHVESKGFFSRIPPAPGSWARKHFPYVDWASALKFPVWRNSS